MKTELIAIRLNPAIAREISNLAGASNLDRAEFLRYWIGAIARLKREYATRALHDIPLQRFRGLPGRPSDSTDPFETPEQPSSK